MICKSYIKKGALVAAVATALTATAAQAEQKSREQRAAAQEVYWSAGDEPPSMDPNKQVDTLSYFWLGHVFEGLMSYDKNGNVVPATAESFQVSPDKKTWTFKIRKGAKWQDGQPVKAQDFVYAWQRLVDPAFASEYSFIATVAAFENADDIIGKKKPKETLGAKAVDDQTLEVKLSRPVTFFDSLMAFQAFFPVRKDIVEKFADKFAAVPESIVGNGPFKLARWQKEQSMRIEKSDTYWNASAIKLKAIESPSMVKDAQANFNNFQTGGIDFVAAASPEIIKQAQDSKLKVESFPAGCVSYLEMNVRDGKVFSNKELRLALQSGVNRSEYVNKIIGIPGTKPIFGIVPDYLPGSKKGATYRKEAPLPFKDNNVAEAQKHLKTYLESTKQAKVPSFTLLSGDSTRAKKYAEYWQSALSKLLNAEVKIESVPFKTRLQRSRDGAFDMAMSGWCPDYRDAMTYMDLFTSKNDNNHGAFHNAQYDKAIEAAANEPDEAKRVKLFAEAEKYLVTEAPIVPTEQTGGAYVIAPALKGMKRNVFGVDPDFRYAEWTKSTSH